MTMTLSICCKYIGIGWHQASVCVFVCLCVCVCVCVCVSVCVSMYVCDC